MAIDKGNDALAEAERHWVEGDPQRAAEAARRARLHYHDARDPDGEASALILLGDMELDADRLSDARQAYVEARQLLAPSGEQAHQAAVLMRLGLLHRLEETPREAVECFQSAIELFSAAGDLSGEALANMQIGHVARGLEQRDDDAVMHYTHARALYSKAGDTLGEAHAMKALGHLQTLLGHADKAHEMLEGAIERFAENGDSLDEAEATGGLGLLLRSLGDEDAAFDAFRRASKLYAGAGHLEGEAEMLMEIGEIEAGRNPKHARKTFQHAAELFQRAGQQDLHEAAVRAADTVARAETEGLG
ncbi:tetratricopeptide repeat protein [Caenispirillum bisanense]|uniref:Tetratricopeptide repeat-containing protein n=1 Tax=Caenispirillum bisanense TaxID=414052 RepID=A0A286G039_9PROT|nr:tetratricopeptide repeat protein [Caenispirillum bisanense]SOD88875.1 Tetratricopeptide repeat-containing protein [Caenispirillum bisanense]